MENERVDRAVQAFSHEWYENNTPAPEDNLACALRKMLEAYDDAPGLREGFGDLPSSLKNGMRFVHHEGIGGPATCEKCGTLYSLAMGGCPKCNPPLIRPSATEYADAKQTSRMHCIDAIRLLDTIEDKDETLSTVASHLRFALSHDWSKEIAQLTRALDFRNAQHDIERRRANAAVACGANLIRRLLTGPRCNDDLCNGNVKDAIAQYHADEQAAAENLK